MFCVVVVVVVVVVVASSTFSFYKLFQQPLLKLTFYAMSLVAARSLARTLAVRRCAPAALGRATPTVQSRFVQTVPKLGSEAEMKAEVIDQIRARIAYQKEVMAANPHKTHDEEWVELWTWIKISIFVCVPGTILMLVKDAAIEEHHHRPDGPMPEYMSIRSKEFPWECDSCALFDLDCWKKCRADKAASA